MQRVERAEHRAAFELYYSLGYDRSLQAVADKMGKNKRTIQNWSSKYNWENKVAQRSLEIAKQAGSERLHRETLAIRAQYRRAIDTLFKQAYKDIRDGKLQIESVEDFECLVKLDLLLMGEPTEIVSSDVIGELQENYTEFR